MFVDDDWNQCHTSKYATFAGMVQEGAIRDEHTHGEIGAVVAGLEPGRESDAERILFRHKGFAISDIVLGHPAYEKAKERGAGTPLTYYASPRDE